MLNTAAVTLLECAFSTVETANLFISYCSRKTRAVPLRGSAFSICVGIWKIVEAENFLECQKKKKKLLGLLNWVFPNVSAKGRQLFFFKREKCLEQNVYNVLNNRICIKFSWNLNHNKSFYVSFCGVIIHNVFANTENTFFKIIETILLHFKSNMLFLPWDIVVKLKVLVVFLKISFKVSFFSTVI